MLRRNVNIDDTIFALLTGTSFPSAVSVIRLSGEKTFSILNKIFKPTGKKKIRKGIFRGELLDINERKIDDILLLVFPKPNSYTGEDVVEFHCHGSLVVVEALTETLLSLGARIAEKGEFTYRAFINGKLSVEELENLADIYKAKDTSSLRAIYERSSEATQLFFKKLRQRLIDIQAIADTAIDFEEEYPNVISQLKEPLSLIIHECSTIIQRYSKFSDPQIPVIVLVGMPNVGKSSLFNALLGRKRALVHHKPGTTRDIIEEEVEIEGKRWKLADTAGIRKTGSSLESEAIEIAKKYAAEANLCVLVIDSVLGVTDIDRQIIDLLEDKLCVIAFNKIDLPNLKPIDLKTHDVVNVSAVTGEGIEKLWLEISKAVSKAEFPTSSIPLPSMIQRNALERLKDELSKIDFLTDDSVPEIISEQIRKGVLIIEDAIGGVNCEEVLDRIFDQFCVGK